MRVLESSEAVRVWRAHTDGAVGFVPTMGALHEGHLSLVRRARAECERTVVSIYVNPAQFGPHEDLAKYPRTLADDLVKLERESVDAVFVPTDHMIYPPGFTTWVEVHDLTTEWEGRSRPGHFRGVATVVLKLLNIVQPDRAYFGEKDYQQLRVVERMVRDLDVPTAIVACPTVREIDGLAMSSRNVRLSADERRAATVLSRSLEAVKDAYRNGERDADELRRIVEKVLGTEPLARVDYIGIAEPLTLRPLREAGREGAVCCIAVRIGDTRLIDNVVLALRAGAP